MASEVEDLGFLIQKKLLVKFEEQAAFQTKTPNLLIHMFFLNNIFNFLKFACLETCGHFIYIFPCVSQRCSRDSLKWTPHFWAVRPPWVFYRSFCPSPAFTDPKPGIDDQFLVLPADAWMNDLSTQGVFFGRGWFWGLCQLWGFWGWHLDDSL